MTERQRYYYEKRLDDTLFQTWGASYGWIKAAGENTRDITFISRLRVKMLILIAECDDMVVPKETMKYAIRQDNTKYVLFHEGKHELFNDTEETIEKFWNEILGFLEQE